MKVKTDDSLGPLGQILPLAGKDVPAALLQSGSPFAQALEEFMSQHVSGKTGFESLDKDQLMSLVTLMNLRMSYTAMSSFGGPDGDSEEGYSSPVSLFSSLSGMPALDSFDKAQQRIGDLTARHGTARHSNTGFASIIGQASKTYGVDSSLIESVIQAESGFDPDATSPKGAMGLMQLMPDTAKGLGVKNAYDPEENIMAGTRYLKWLLDRYGGDVRTALAAYNWGMGNVERGTGRMPDETREYIARIMKSYRSDSV